MTTNVPVQLINPTGSTIGQVIRSSGPSSAPAWGTADASNATFTQIGTGAVQRTVQLKLQESLSVLDFGADATGVADSTTAFQNAINEANTLGLNVSVPGGTYKLTSGIILDNSADSTQTAMRTSIIGTNPHGCVLNFGAGSYNCITIKGSNTNGGADSLQRLENVFVNKADNLGTCFLLEQTSHLQVKNCRANGSNTGFVCIDFQESTFENCVAEFANGGFLAQAYSAFTGFNGIQFLNCKFGNCNNYGVDLQNAACVNFFGGSIEGNVTNAVGTTTWGIRYITTSDSTLQGTVGLNMYGVYIENNGYNGTPTTPNGDIWIVNSTSPSVSNIIGCSFQRHAYFCTNNIRIDGSGSASQIVNIHGNGFRGYADYTANAGRPYWLNNGGSFVTVNAWGNKYQNATETPVDAFLTGNLSASAFAKVLATNTSAQSIANNAFTAVTGWTSTYDVNSNFNAATGTFTAPIAGKYMVSAKVSFGTLTGGAGVGVGVGIFVGGVQQQTGHTVYPTTSTFGNIAAQVCAVVNMTAGQTLTIDAYQNNGGAAALASGAASNYVSIDQIA